MGGSSQAAAAMPQCCSTPAAAATAENGVLHAGARVLPAPAIPLNTFMLEPEEVAALRQRHGLSIEALMQALVAPAALLARPPTSDFPVGAIGLGVSGRLYAGVNLEFPRLPLQHSVHAEQFLVANAAWHGEAALRRIAVNAAPCGHCRQFLAELADAGSVALDYKGHTWALDAILADKFCPGDLITPGTVPLLLQPQANAVALGKAATAMLAGCSDDATLQEAARQALAAAARCYAPYTGCPAGLALVSEAGGVYAGGLIESCAYNPTINPLQAACITFVAQGKGAFTEVSRAVLVELPDCSVSQEDSTRMALHSISPCATLTVLHLQRC